MVTFVLISLDLIERSLVNDDLQTDKDCVEGFHQELDRGTPCLIIALFRGAGLQTKNLNDPQGRSTKALRDQNLKSLQKSENGEQWP